VTSLQYCKQQQLSLECSAPISYRQRSSYSYHFAFLQFGVLEAVRLVTRRGCVASVAAVKQQAAAAAGTAGAGSSVLHARTGAFVGQLRLKQATSALVPAVDNTADQNIIVSDVDHAREDGIVPKSEDLPQRQSRNAVTAIWVTHRFEELSYADEASYMKVRNVVCDIF
jgi:hypothetical protein